MKVQPGQLIGGKYELERLLGQGSMGQVWRARHATLEDAYAVKLIDVKRVPDAAGRFQLEAHIAAKLSKKTRHVVSVTDHGEDDQLAYLVMQLLEGQSLEQRIEEAAPLSLEEIGTIVTQVARALKYAHAEGFVHRDIKPANVFLTKDEEGRTMVKLLDFGIARSRTKVQTRSPFATAKDTIVGTPSYMSPEQTIGHEAVDHRCDLWSLAVVAYEALAHALPFEGETLQDVLISIGIGRQVPMQARRQDLPAAVYAFFDKAFADAIEDRFSSATELATAFARAIGTNAGAPSVAPPPSAKRADEEPIHLPMRRGSRRIAAAALALGLALVGLAAFVSLRTPETPSAPDPHPSPPDAAPAAVPPSAPPTTPTTLAPSEAPANPTPPPASAAAQPPRVASASASASAPASASASALASASVSASASASAPTPPPAPPIDRGEVF